MLAGDAHAIEVTHISEQGRFGVARFRAEDAGIPALGYNTPLRAIGQTLWRAVEARGARVCCPARVQGLVAEDTAITLTMEDGQPPLRARLVVAADGGDSQIRQLLGIPARRRRYEQQAIVTAVRVSRDHAAVAYERFTPEGPLAVLPKGERMCSLVWSLPDERAAAMMGLPDDAFRADAQAAFGARLGRFLELGARAAHPLEQLVVAQPLAPRVVFIGNAAQTLHPVAAQGFNLGLRDAAVLAHMIGDAADPGAPEVLQAFVDQRARDRRAASDFTDHLVRLFSNRVPGLAQTRHWGLLALDMAAPIKRRIRDQSLGYLGLSPGLPTPGPGS
jgi:2-octaprenyl-6-methoxyphenol hydroxylase